MVEQDWSGLSLLYVTPLRALLNNLEPRLAGYAGWLGRRVGLWHGDVGASARRAMLADPPEVLLTTPESIEAMLVSTHVDHRALFTHLRAVVVDELHAFAGDDRGWHLLAVLERVQRLAGHRIQRVGLSATVGNPDERLAWLAGAIPPARAEVVAPDLAGPSGPGSADVTLDYVGTVANAATVIAALHGGEKRLVFCDSRAQAEALALALREPAITTFVSHSSLSAEERRRSEQAFAEARDCVVVATSTLELGIDVGDLDRVIQLDAPRTVASFLQRLGRTGRRPGTTRNTPVPGHPRGRLPAGGGPAAAVAGRVRRAGGAATEPRTSDPDTYASSIAGVVFGLDTTYADEADHRALLMSEADPQISSRGVADLERMVGGRISEPELWARMRANEQWSQWQTEDV